MAHDLMLEASTTELLTGENQKALEDALAQEAQLQDAHSSDQDAWTAAVADKKEGKGMFF